MSLPRVGGVWSGGGIVLEDLGLYVEAHGLAERGWLERRFDRRRRDVVVVDAAAETALDISALTADRSSAVN